MVSPLPIKFALDVMYNSQGMKSITQSMYTDPFPYNKHSQFSTILFEVPGEILQNSTDQRYQNGKTQE